MYNYNIQMLHMVSESITELNKRVKVLKKQQVKKQKELNDIESDIDLIESLIKLKKERKSFHHYMKGLHKKEIPKAYREDIFWKEKVVFAISELGTATVKQIADYMSKKEPKVDYKLLYTTTQQMTMKLTKEYKLIKMGDYASEYKLNIIDE